MSGTNDPDILYVSGLVAAIFRSPTWVSPIATFVDENCSIFEDQEENKLEYTLIHNAFKQLVDELLEAHLHELSVTQEQFARFCEHGLHGDNEFHRELVEQLLSVDDFLVFKAMMVKRNAQLYSEALKMFGYMVMQASAPPGAEAPGLPPPPDPAAQALAGSQELLPEKSGEQVRLEGEAARLEQERAELQRKCVEAELQLAMALSLQLQKRLQLMEALSEILEAITQVKEGSEEAKEVEATMEALCVQPIFMISDQAPPEVEAAHAAQQRERAERAVETSRQQAAAKAAVAAPAGPSEEEKRARTEHLKRQREALMEKKRRDREEQLAAHREAFGATAAASAAQGAIERQPAGDDAGKRLAAELSGQAPAPPPPPAVSAQDTAAAEMRRALTRQLKQTFTGGGPLG